MAFADNIQDSIVDGTTITKLTTDPPLTTEYFVTASSNTGNNDPANCNITLGERNLELTITVDPPGIVNVSQNPVVLPECNPAKYPVTFSSAQGGTFQVSVSGITPVFDQNNIQTGWLFTDSDGYTYSINP